jgi:hypothetical protein
MRAQTKGMKMLKEKRSEHRPKPKGFHRVEVWLTEEDSERLDEFRAEIGASTAEAIRELIRDRT